MIQISTIREKHTEALPHLGETYQATANHRATRDSWQQAVTILDGGLQHPDAVEVRQKLHKLDLSRRARPDVINIQRRFSGAERQRTL